jgi:hypothetical protein
MRYILLLAVVVAGFSACKKDKFNTVPQIKFKSISPNTWLSTNLDPTQGPVLTINLTDAEGDFGFNDNKDTSYIYVKNITVSPFKQDSLKFPVLTGVKTKDLDVDLDINLRAFLASSSGTPHTDTLKFEVYVKDFAKNKSNVIIAEPVYYVVP